MSHGQLNPGIGTQGLQQIMQLPILRRSPRQFDQVILKKLGILRICYDKHQKPPWSRFSVALPLTYSRGFIYSTVKSDPRTLFQPFLGHELVSPNDASFSLCCSVSVRTTSRRFMPARTSIQGSNSDSSRDEKISASELMSPFRSTMMAGIFLRIAFSMMAFPITVLPVPVTPQIKTWVTRS